MNNDQNTYHGFSITIIILRIISTNSNKRTKKSQGIILIILYVCLDNIVVLFECYINALSQNYINVYSTFIFRMIQNHFHRQRKHHILLLL